MGIKIQTNIKETLSSIDLGVEKLKKDLISIYEEAAIRIIDEAKLSHTYKNRTHNLEASTGYGVVVNGVLVSFGGFDDSCYGGQIGLQKLESIVPLINRDECAIIVVAGMEYATYVERSGYVVLDSARFTGEEILLGMLESVRLEV